MEDDAGGSVEVGTLNSIGTVVSPKNPVIDEIESDATDIAAGRSDLSTERQC